MFSKLGELESQRTKVQALGFYIAYLLLGFIIGALSGIAYALITGNDDQQAIFRIGTFSAMAYCPLLAYLVANSKNILASFKVIVLILLSSAIAIFIGALGGLIPVAYLTTISPHNKQSQADA